MLDDAVSKFLGRRRVAAARQAIRPAEKGSGLAPYRVVIAGGGVAALEAALAIDELAGDLVALQIVAPGADFVYKPLEVREPFAGASAPRFSLEEFAESIGAELVVDRLERVAPLEHRLFTTGGAALTYDALLLCLGAQPVRRHEHARMLESGKLDETLHGFIQDVEEGYIKSAAFIVPERVGWPLPLYELLLMTADRARSMLAEIDLTLITSEAAPLDVFGSEASAAVAERLAAAGVTVLTSASAEVPGNKQVDVTVGGIRTQLAVDSIISLPELVGPNVDGLPSDDAGFLPVDEYGHLLGEDRIFAAGDGTDGRVKQGGVAAQQGASVALGIAKLAGAAVEPLPLHPVMSGLLLTGGEPLVLGAPIDRPAGRDSVLGKIAAPRLAGYLAAHEPTPAAARS